MMGGQERQMFPWGKWDWLSGGPCALGPPEAEKRRRLLQGALHLQLPQAVTRGFGTWQGPVAEVQAPPKKPESAYCIALCSHL